MGWYGEVIGKDGYGTREGERERGGGRKEGSMCLLWVGIKGGKERGMCLFRVGKEGGKEREFNLRT